MPSLFSAPHSQVPSIRPPRASAGRNVLVAAAVQLTLGWAAALPAAAQTAATPPADERPADTNAGQPVQLGRVKVEEVEGGYKAEQAASPKFTEPLRDTPQTIQVITSDLFNQQGATSLTEALRNTAGAGTFYAGENGSTSTGDAVYMRGFDASSSIFVDGVRDVTSVTRDVFNLDSIEVQKGPAGTDYGRVTPAGSINLNTKEAFLGSAVSGYAAGGLDGQKRAVADVNQTLGAIPGAALRLNVLWEDSDVTGRDHVNNSRSGIASSFGLGLDGATRAHLDLLYVTQNNVPDGFVPTIGLPGWTPQAGLEQLAGHPVDPTNYYGTSDSYDRDTSEMATLRIDHDFSGDVQLRNIARWGQTRQNYLIDSFMGNNVNITFTDPDDLSTYKLARTNYNVKDQLNRILTDQLNLRVNFKTGAVQHHFSTGLEWAREELITYGNTTVGSEPAANLYDPDWNDVGTLSLRRNGAGSDGVTRTVSAYAFDTLSLLDRRVLVVAGLRADHYTTDFVSSTACGGTARGAVACPTGVATGTPVQTIDADATGTLVNWKLGVVYKPVEAGSLYADYAISQQPPGGSSFQLSAAATSLDNPNLDPQKARTFEIGTKWDLFNAGVLLNLALFRTDVSNEINANDLDDNGNPTQSGQKRVQGVEISAAGNITENWALTAGYTRMSTKVEQGPVVTADGTSNLTYTPDDAFTSWTTYKHSGFTVGGGVRYVGGLHRGTDNPLNGTPTQTGSYVVWDGILSYEVTRQLSLRMNGYNLFDRQYVAAINKSGFRYTPGTPRTFIFTADFRF